MKEKAIHTRQAEIWANVQDVTGYTFAAALDARNLNNQIGKATDWPNRYPSVYYKKGHATLDHERANNVGWEGGVGWRCLFFNNVGRADARAAADARDSDDHDEKLDFIDRVAHYGNALQNGHWLPLVLHTHGRLVEIWRTPDGEIRVHPSRNVFRLADSSLTRLLHDLAMNTKIMQRSRADAREMKI